MASCLCLVVRRNYCPKTKFFFDEALTNYMLIVEKMYIIQNFLGFIFTLMWYRAKSNKMSSYIIFGIVSLGCQQLKWPLEQVVLQYHKYIKYSFGGKLLKYNFICPSMWHTSMPLEWYFMINHIGYRPISKFRFWTWFFRYLRNQGV